jgi:hypothetical protein
MWAGFVKLLTETIPLEVRTRVVACTAFCLLVAWMAWSTGAFPFFKGFAYSDDLQQLTAAIKQQRAEQDKDAILTLRETECRLPKGQSKAIYTATIATRMAEYFRITGQGFSLPDCSDF